MRLDESPESFTAKVNAAGLEFTIISQRKHKRTRKPPAKPMPNARRYNGDVWREYRGKCGYVGRES